MAHFDRLARNASPWAVRADSDESSSEELASAPVPECGMARVVRFMFDYGHAWPLWENGTDKYAMEPSDYELSPDLTERLQSCYEYWEAHCDLEGQWDAPDSRDRWLADTDQTIAILRWEVSSFADVRDERDWGVRPRQSP